MRTCKSRKAEDEVDASQLAVDPDGQIVRITSAEVNGSMSDFQLKF